MTPYFTDCQYVVDIQALEQRPHGEIDIDEPTTEIESARETRDDFKIRVAAIAFGTCVKFNQIPCTRGGMRKNFGDLEGMGLHILGETCP
jgi:hypothetical protein